MKVLGIETSCDETAAAVVEDGNRLLSNAVASSMDLQAQYGGVVPEIAARSHMESIMPVIEQALSDAECTWDDIDAIAVTYGAGLGGSLLVGVMTARTLAITKGKPLYGINHVEGHIYVNFLVMGGGDAGERRPSNFSAPALIHRTHGTAPSAPHGKLQVAPFRGISADGDDNDQEDDNSFEVSGKRYVLPVKQPEFPLLGLIVSGGHSQIVYWRDHFDYTLLGQTADDAIGEAFDKVAKIIGVPYPGGPNVAKMALQGDPYAYDLPKSKVDVGSEALVALRAAHGSVNTKTYDYSFSGVKTAVLRVAQAAVGKDHRLPSYELPGLLSEAQKADIAASFQRVAVETVVDKVIMAVEEFGPRCVVIGGGVAASSELRCQLAERLPFPAEYTDPKLCTDNGAMIATLGCYQIMQGVAAVDPYTLAIEPNLSM